MYPLHTMNPTQMLHPEHICRLDAPRWSVPTSKAIARTWTELLLPPLLECYCLLSHVHLNIAVVSHICIYMSNYSSYSCYYISTTRMATAAAAAAAAITPVTLHIFLPTLLLLLLLLLLSLLILLQEYQLVMHLQSALFGGVYEVAWIQLSETTFCQLNNWISEVGVVFWRPFGFDLWKLMSCHERRFMKWPALTLTSLVSK